MGVHDPVHILLIDARLMRPAANRRGENQRLKLMDSGTTG
jgi:hypothetical protein